MKSKLSMWDDMEVVCVQCIEMIRCTRIFTPRNLRMHWMVLEEVIRFDLTQYSHLPLSEWGKQKQENNKKHLCEMIDDNYCWQSEVKCSRELVFAQEGKCNQFTCSKSSIFRSTTKRNPIESTNDSCSNFCGILNSTAHESSNLLSIQMNSVYYLLIIKCDVCTCVFCIVS